MAFIYFKSCHFLFQDGTKSQIQKKEVNFWNNNDMKLFQNGETRIHVIKANFKSLFFCFLLIQNVTRNSDVRTQSLHLYNSVINVSLSAEFSISISQFFRCR